jgi:putative ATPase
MNTSKPLAARIRPDSLEGVFGQEHLTTGDGFLAQCVKNESPTSIIFWGPPGCGKTTLAKIYANAFKANLVQISAVSAGVADLKKVTEEAKGLQENGVITMLFVDEIHRFNKRQQDFFLPFVEDGTIILIGATTENPSFEVNSALLSRTQVLVLNTLNEEALEKIMLSAEEKEHKLSLDDDARKYLIESASGDGRYLLNLIDMIFSLNKESISLEDLVKLLQKRFSGHDKNGDSHYNLISALHKSIRGSDPDASLYWFARMLEGGENPLYLARRLIRIAVEDIGLADPQALLQANAAREAFSILGTPEGELALAQCVVYLSLAPKSNAVYKAFGDVQYAVKKSSQLPPPKHILNAPTKLMKDMDYGTFYQYDHDTPNCFSGQNYFPEKVKRQKFYKPKPRGFEREMEKRVDYFNKLRSKIT